MLDFCRLNGLRICNGRIGSDSGVGKYTYVGSTGCSVVDYVITNPSLLDFIHEFDIGEPNILSDHCAVQFSIYRDREPTNAFQTGEMPHEILNKKYVWDETKTDQYMCNLNSEEEAFSSLIFQLRQAKSSNEIDQNIDMFSNLMSKICDPLFTKKLKTCTFDGRSPTDNFSRPWFDEECRQSRFLFYNELNKFRSNRSTQNQCDMITARSNFRKLIRQKRFFFDKSKTEKLLASRYQNAKEYWRLLKQASNINTKQSVTSEQFAQYFKAVNDPNDKFYQADDDVLLFNERYLRGEFQIIFNELNTDISVEEIKTAIKQLRNGASGGPDLWLNEFFKKSSEILFSYVHNLFNKLFQAGYFPQKWAEGHIVPIFKKGDVNEVSNYRGITLLSTIGKLFTRVLNDRLNSWAENYSIYIEAQAGFRKHMSTVDNIFVLSGLITHCINNNEHLYCCFVDFTKAFDFVVRDILWYKLLKAGVRGRMLDIVKSIYSVVKSQVWVVGWREGAK